MWLANVIVGTTAVRFNKGRVLRRQHPGAPQRVHRNAIRRGLSGGQARELAAAVYVCTSRCVYDDGHADQFLAEDRETLTVTMRAATTARSASQTLLSPRHHDSPSDYSAVPK